MISRQIILTLGLVIFSVAGYAQTDSLLNSLETTTSSKQELLPKKMLFTQRWAWGEHGFLRGNKPVTSEVRLGDMKTRRKMLIAHQMLGIATLGGLIGEAIVGPKLFNDPTNRSLRQTHSTLAALTDVTYSLTAVMALFSPPPMVNRDKGLSAIRLHKWLAVIHMTGMLATNILASQIEGNHNPQLRVYHRTAAYVTFASFAAAMVVIKLK